MSSSDSKIQFLEKINQSILMGTFIKLTLSKYKGEEATLKNIYARYITIKNEPRLSFVYRYQTKDITKNHIPNEGIQLLNEMLGTDFLNAELFTTQEDISLQFNKKRIPKIHFRPASSNKASNGQHDKTKKRLIQANKNQYLSRLGITNSEGHIKKDGQRKFKQINKYIEIIEGILRKNPLPASPHIVDMGSGKGYLTFALYDYLNEQMNLEASITGIELKENLVESTNQIAKEIGFSKLQFIAQDIMAYDEQKIDMLIALHACDIATDIAIAKGIQSDASVIIVAPCCHKQIRKEMNCSTSMQSILRHGILLERQAELVTDGIRALLLEANGYQTKVFEFISTEHTPKNVMIVATKGKVNEEALEKVEAIKKEFGIKEHYLENLLIQNKE